VAVTLVSLCIGLAFGFLVGYQTALVSWVHLSMSHSADGARASPDHAHQFQSTTSDARGVLVLYSFFEGDEVSWGNLYFFLGNGIKADDGAQYIIILNGITSLQDERLTLLPSNARYVLHANECYDWGTYAWVLDMHVKEADYECAPLPCMCKQEGFALASAPAVT
jgi:hypothetical protein